MRTNISSQFIFGTAVVIFATYLYSGSGHSRKRPPPINIVNYEKTTIDNGYTPKGDDESKQLGSKLPTMESLKSAGLSTSRPSSPMRHHSRVGSSRGRVKRDD